MTESMLSVTDVGRSIHEKVEIIHGSTYKDCSTVVIVPTRGMIHHRVVSCWQALMAPMNQKRCFVFCTGSEVGDAYNRMLRNVLENPELSRWKFVLSLEDDNIVPHDAHLRLLETLHDNPDLDAVGGIYWTKGAGGMPLALGDPEKFATTGEMDFAPRDMARALKSGQRLLEVNGLPQGCTLFRMDLFRYVAEPWFVTMQEGNQMFTQDLFFWNRARRLGKRCAIDLSVRVGHLDVSTGEVW